MHRLSSGSISKEYYAVDLPSPYPMPPGKLSPLLKKKIDVAGAGDFELKRENRRSERWIHLIPLVVMLCLFILWFYSYPVELEIRDGRVTAVDQMKTLLVVNGTRVDLTVLARATPPNVPVSQIFKLNTTFAPQLHLPNGTY